MEDCGFIIEQFNQVVSNYPNSIAVRTAENKITYNDLGFNVNHFVQIITEKTKRHKASIALMFTRSINYIYCLLAVLKSGCHFVPIDLEFPINRIEYILKMSEVSVILTDFELDNIDTKDIIVVDIRKEHSREVDNLAERCDIAGHDLAYIIFTSGSTGLPKGVEIQRQALDNLMKSAKQSFNFDRETTFLANTSFSFDISIIEILLPVVCGATIYLTNDIEQKNPRKLLSIIKNGNIDFAQFTPSTILYLMACDDELSGFEKLKYVWIGGEIFPMPLLKKLQGFEKLNIYNMYGPTEATIWVTYANLSKSDNVNIGIPFDGTKFFIVDENMKEVDKGELLISGECLARGYIRDNQLTSKKFIKFNGKRCYRTGDLAEISEGKLFILGRTDNQIKLMGHRIEIEEIESVIMMIPEVKQVAVDLEDNKLFAYYTGKLEIGKIDFIREIRKRLPDYMIPNRYIRLNEMPLTISGKVDRKSIKKFKDVEVY